MNQLFQIVYAISENAVDNAMGTTKNPYKDYVSAKNLPAALDILRMGPSLGGRFELIVLKVKRLGLISQ
jgi:hypothetical protein